MGTELTVLQAGSLRKLIEQANERHILKDDIVQVIKNEETFFLLYYK